ncbi:hypothetical protein [Yoonia sp.]|uniref:hypothetical protein n=1 Tax=Yoonia sp. TaxID=2212373 RepID=UPI0039188FA4
MDDSPLIAKLKALVGNDPVFLGKARVISTGGIPMPLDALLAEIDDTVLERTLVFDIDGLTLRAAVAGRRLRGVLDVTDQPVNGFIGQVLSQDDPDMRHRISALLADLCNNAEQITVKSLPAENFGDPSDAGISAAALTQDTREMDPPSSSPMGQFLAAIGTDVTAFLYVVKGEIVRSKGDTTAVDLAWCHQSDPLRNSQKAIFPQDKDPTLTCLAPALRDGQAIAIARIGDEIGVLSYPSDGFGHILAAWHETTR